MAIELTSREWNAIRELYENRLRELGQSIETVGWGSRESQALRFQQLFRGIDGRSKKILDFGCGLADLIPFLDETLDGQFEYVGLDICEGLLEAAANRYADREFRFVTGDLMTLSGSVVQELKCDIAVASGAFSFKLSDNFGYATSVIRRLNEIASQVVSVNFLTTHVDFELEKNHHYSPEEMLQFAFSCSRRVAIYHDYPLWEFTLQMFCDQ